MKSIETTVKYIVWGAIFLIPFIVFIVDSSLVFPFIAGKNFAFRVLVELAFFGWLTLAFLREEYRPKTSSLLLSVAVFVGVMFVANVFGIEPKQSFWSNFERMEGWVTLIHLFAYVLVLSSMLNTKDLWRKFWNTTVIASVGMGLFAMLQLFRKYLVDTLGRSADEGLARLLPIVNQGGSRLDATLGNATYLAVYMLLHIFITTTLLLRYKSLTKGWKLFYGFALVLQFVSLFHTATRGAILGLIGGALVSALLFVIFEKRGTVVKRFASGVLIVVVLLGGLFFVAKDSEFVKNQNTLNRLANISLEDNTTKSRFIMWDLAWKGVKERPVLGYGQGNFNYVFNTHYNPELYNQEQWFDRTHNVVFDWLIAGGFVGFAAYVAIFVFLIRMLIRNDQLSRREKIVFVGMVAAYIFQNMFVFDQIASYMLIFAFIAYVHSLQAKKDLLPHVFDITEGTRDRVVVPVLLVGMLVTPYFVNASGYMQGKTAIDALNMGQARTVQELNQNVAETLEEFQKAIGYDAMGTAEVRERLPQIAVQVGTAEQVDAGLQQQVLTFARDQMQQQVEETPDDARYRLIYGGYLAQLGLFDEAIVQLERAVELTPNKQVVQGELAKFYAQNDQPEKAFETARDAYEIYEENHQAWASYVLFAQLTEREELVDQLIDEALEDEQYERLIQFFQSQIRNNPETLQFRTTLASIYVDSGQVEKGVAQLESFKATYPDQFTAEAEALLEELTEQAQEQ